MKHSNQRLRALVALGLVLTSMIGSIDSFADRRDANASTVDTPAVELVALPAHYEDLVEWALSRYDEAGLELPPLRIVHHGDDQAPCGGSTGRHHCDDGVSVIDLCTTTGGTPAERLVLHELAHAWSAHDLDDDRRAAFQELRGWTHWFAADGVSWLDLGGEQAAEIIASGVSDRATPTVLVDQSSCEDLRSGYRTLTGTEPPHGIPGRC